MEKIVLYLYQTTVEAEITSVLEGLHYEQTLKSLTPTLTKLTAQIDPYEPVDYHEIYTLILSDFEMPVTFLTLPGKLFDTLNEDIILNYLEKLPKNFYDGEDFLLSLIKRCPEVMPSLQKSISKNLEKSLIETTLAIADANMNLSIAAKRLYMHRNTLHYRIDKVIEQTGINIKTFKGLSIFNLLFKH